MDEMTWQARRFVAGRHLPASITLALILIFPFNTAAQTGAGLPGAFLRLGVGARALSMGGAFVAMADDPSATYWNPAGLQQINHLRFEFMNADLPFDQSLRFLSGAIPLRNNFTLGVAWIGLQVDQIEARTSNTAEPDFTFGSSQNAFLISLSKPLNQLLAVGGSMKFIQSRFANFSASGFGFDASLLAQPMDGLKVGFVVQDLGTDYRWKGGLTEGVPMTLRLGGAWKAHEYITVTTDFSRTSGQPVKPGFGAEVRPIHSLPIRLGLREGRFSGGFGVGLPLSGHSVELNYSYGTDRVFNDATHRISVGFSFKRGQQRKTPERLRPIRPDAFAVKESDYMRTVEPARVPLTQVQPETWIRVHAAVLNVRSGPGSNYDRIGQVRRGQKFRAFESHKNWQRIKLGDGRVGWVYSDYVQPLLASKLD